MSNHYHLTVKLAPEQLDKLSDDQVMERWMALYRGSILVQRYRNGEELSPAERNAVSDIINVWRKRLGNLSWFMKCLNEPIARKANREDECTGHFWEARFKSQALRSSEALISCMVYVDLNPVRAATAKTPETSEYTSIQERIKPTFVLANAIQQDIHNFPAPLKPLLQFDDNIIEKNQKSIPFTLTDYLDLVDCTGRAVVSGKRGFIPGGLPAIIERLKVKPDQWFAQATNFEQLYRRILCKHPRFANIV